MYNQKVDRTIEKPNIPMEGSNIKSMEMGEQPKDKGTTLVKQSSYTFQQLNRTYRDKDLSLTSFEQTD